VRTSGSATRQATIVASDGDSERVSLLGRPWTLREVEDVEAFVRTILETRLERKGARLRPDVHADAVAYLLEVAVRADRSYDSSRGTSFEQYLGWKISNGVVDFYRREFGRTRWQFSDWLHERERPEPLSLDGSDGSALESPLGASPFELADSRIDLERAFAS
jgi:hypothetical protein